MVKAEPEYLEIYFPMTMNILTVGHIKCLEWLTQYGFVTVGLLTAKGLKGYKKELMPFKDRKYILEMLALCIEDIKVVPQDSLNPFDNIKKYKCNSLASGDGFEPEELYAISRLQLKKIEIKLKGEKKKSYSTRSILDKDKCGKI